ncbi:MAG: hypothetical protein OET90_03075 [Desulfuromonadales bacterium]|nr:hypothetical protein [Desulfuromonadales bacterium]
MRILRGWMLLVAACWLISGTAFAGKFIETVRIQDGAVTNSKITGPISAAKIEAGYFQTKHSNVVVVAKSGGDFTDINNAMLSIRDLANRDNPYLIKVMPGVYHMGASGCSLSDFISLEGSGKESTIFEIDPYWSTVGTRSVALRINGESAVRNLSIKFINETPGNQYWRAHLTAIEINSANAVVENVAIQMPDNRYCEDRFGVKVINGGVELRNVTGCGMKDFLYLENSQARVDNCRTNACSGITLLIDDGGSYSYDIVNSSFGRLTFDAANGAVSSMLKNVTVQDLVVMYNAQVTAAHSQIGALNNIGGEVKFFGCYDNELNPIN